MPRLLFDAQVALIGMITFSHLIGAFKITRCGSNVINEVEFDAVNKKALIKYTNIIHQNPEFYIYNIVSIFSIDIFGSQHCTNKFDLYARMFELQCFITLSLRKNSRVWPA